MIVALLAALLTATPPSTEPIPDGYMPLVDSTNAIVLAVPHDWAEVDIAPAMTEAGYEVPYIAASPDLETFYGAFNTPGVLYAAFPYVVNPLDYVDQFGLTAGCEAFEVREYDDPIFVGVIQIGTNCGPHAMTWNMVIASPADHTFTAVVQVQAVDPTRIETVLLTFNIGPGPVEFVVPPPPTGAPSTAAVTTSTGV